MGLNRRVASLAFVLLATIATLFPPFHWGEEQLQTERERGVFRRFHSNMAEQIPIKSYSFLFGSSSRAFVEWAWDGRQSIQEPIVLRRRLVASELVLEYVLSGLVARAIGIGASGRLSRTSRPGF